MKCTACNEPVTPIVAIDIDGTLGDYYTHFQAFAWDYHNIIPPLGQWDGVGEWEDWMGMTKAEYREAKLAYRQGGGKRLMPIYEYATLLCRGVRESGAELWLTTTRPYMRHDSTDPDTRHWLERNGIQYDHLVYDDNKYVRLSTLVDPDRVVMVLDDLPEMLDEANKMFPGTGVQIKRPHNQNPFSVRHPAVADLVQAHGKAVSTIRDWKERYDNGD